ADYYRAGPVLGEEPRHFEVEALSVVRRESEASALHPPVERSEAGEHRLTVGVHLQRVTQPPRDIGREDRPLGAKVEQRVHQDGKLADLAQLTNDGDHVAKAALLQEGQKERPARVTTRQSQSRGFDSKWS